MNDAELTLIEPTWGASAPTPSAGDTLDQLLAERGALSVAESATVLLLAARALGEAHHLGLVHRDLTSSSLFLSVDDDALSVSLVDPARNLGTTRAFVGTPAYCAPEQVAMASAATATDVYALGAIAFEMLAGALPFEGTAVDLYYAKLKLDAPPLIGVPAALSSLVASMLSRDPSARPTLDRVIEIASEHARFMPDDDEQTMRIVETIEREDQTEPLPPLSARRGRFPVVSEPERERCTMRSCTISLLTRIVTMLGERPGA